VSNAGILVPSTKPGAPLRTLGVALDLTQTTGQGQLLYQSVLSTPNIGTLVDPSLLHSDSTAALALNGTIQKVLAGSGANLFTAGTSIVNGTTQPGTYVVLKGSDNTVYGAPG